MVAATRSSFRQALWDVGLLLAVFFVPHISALAQAPPAEDGLFITVRDPITSEEFHRVKGKTERALKSQERTIRTLIYDFNPSGRPSCSKDFGPCADFAAYLLRLTQAKTVAFVHNDVSGHTVLPVLACKDLVMSRNAKLGDVLHDQSEPLLEPEVAFYAYLAKGRKGPPAIVLKMVDKNMEVMKGTVLGSNSVWYVDRRRLAEEGPKVLVPPGSEPVLVAGNPGFYSATQALEYGLCNLIKETRPEVNDAYELSPWSLREDPLEGRDPRAVRVLVRERLTKSYLDTLQRVIRQAIGDHANFIILQLECGGGDVVEARAFAEELRKLKDDTGQFPVMTVAYIPVRAPDAATFVALGCTEIVMGKNAQIGDFEGLVKDDAEPGEYEALQQSLEGLLRDERGYHRLLARAMLDRKLTVYRVQSQKGPAEWTLMTEEQLTAANAADPGKWGNKTLIKARGQNLTAENAKDAGLVREIVGDDFADVRRVYGLKEVRDADLDFLYKLASFLRHPVLAFFLIMIGVACLILELKMPGVSLPGIIAALCFVLYFWAHSQLAGQITMLAILLFVLGLILIGLEIFVLPGFGALGVSGAILVVVSLGLAALEKKPETSQEWFRFGQTMGTVGLGLLGAVLLAFVVAWYLPSIPYASRLVLKPPTEAPEAGDGHELATGESGGLYPAAAELLGAIGVAATPLRPAGVARFGDGFVDVVTEGGYVAAGGRIQVIEIEGNRVVVKEV